MNPVNSFMGSGTYEGALIEAEREGDKDKWMIVSSPCYASEGNPPIILFHDTADPIVNKEPSQVLYDSHKRHDMVTELVYIQGGSHGGNEMYVSEILDRAVVFLVRAKNEKNGGG